MTRRVPRDTTARCPLCGWTSPKRTSVALAARGLSMHSCERKRRDDAVTARDLARHARIDRTPKPCLHPNAGHQHGTRAAYTLDGCRCLPCSLARAEYADALHRRNGAGRSRYTDAAPVREHVRALMAAGMGSKRVAEISGINLSTITMLLWGRGGRAPSARILRTAAATLLALTPDIAPGTSVDATGTVRRVQALVALGWPCSQLAVRIDVLPSNFIDLVHGRRGQVRRGTADTVRDLFDRLQAEVPAPGRATTRARRFAAGYGWAPPAAWDDDTIDNPAALPNLTGGHDEAVVLAWLTGYVEPDAATYADRVEVLRRLVDAGFVTIRQQRLLTGLGDTEIRSARTSMYRITSTREDLPA